MSLEIYKIKNIWDRGRRENDGVSDLKGNNKKERCKSRPKL